MIPLARGHCEVRGCQQQTDSDSLNLEKALPLRHELCLAEDYLHSLRLNFACGMVRNTLCLVAMAGGFCRFASVYGLGVAACVRLLAGESERTAHPKPYSEETLRPGAQSRNLRSLKLNP